MASKVTIDDLAGISQEKSQKTIALYENAAGDYYQNTLLKTNKNIQEGKRLGEEEATAAAKALLKVLVATWMKNKFGVDNPQLDDDTLDELGETHLGLDTATLERQFKLRPVTMRMVAELAGNAGEQVAGRKQQTIGKKLAQYLVTKDGDEFRKQFAQYVEKNTGGKYALDVESMRPMPANEILGIYRQLDAQQDGLDALLSKYAKKK